MTSQDRVNGGRPGDIPEDVWREAMDWPLGDTGDMDADIGEAIARAILAERERCAAVSNSLAEDVQKSADDMQGDMRVHRLHRAAGIRQAVAILRNPAAFAERAAAIRKGGA